MNMIDRPRQRLVLVGNGMAGMRTVEEILARAPGRFRITVFGAEPVANYNRIMLSPLLAGEKSFEDILINDHAWYDDNGVELVAGEKIVEIDRGAKIVKGEHGTRRAYDVLLLATGSNPFILPVPGVDLPGVVTFRDVKDVETMVETSRTHRNAVVIGGGLLGLEAAYGLKRNGMDVTVVHLMPTLMERQLDASAAHLLARDLEDRGIKVLTGANTEALLGDTRVEKIRLKDGTEVAADLVVLAAGIRPNTELAKAAGLTCNRGVVVDDALKTSDPAIYAVGECVEHRGMVHGLVAPLYDMAKICADHIAGVAEPAFEAAATGTRLKVTGIDMFSAGNFLGDETTEDVVLRDAARGLYKRLVLKENKVQGVVCYGDAKDANWYFQLLRDGTDISSIREHLLFGPNAGNAASDPLETLAAMPGTAEICGCNGVCKGKITGAIAELGLTTLDGVRAHTKASASCGSCTPLVEGLLQLSLGDEFKIAAVKPMCKCTSHSHEAVRAAILEKGLKSIPAVMQAMEWATPDGCASCRPALNYYLLCAWPDFYVDDAQSRFVNERNHANIQKDGTYSVVPRMWGGLTSAKELRAIADVVDKYDIPSVKVTGGQRIDLLGVKKEQLPDVWRDLNAAGMVSGHAYGKALRTVKTCVGSEWCRFGTQDSTGMGVALERMTWDSWHPHKVKLAVSGCPRNCAEATIKDFGVIAVDSGWELHVGGNGGIKLRGTEFLCKVETEEEVLEYCGAFLQLYREQARYLERTAHWIERVGLDYVRTRIVQDDELRKELYERFLYAQSFRQTDPWAEHADDMRKSAAFRPMAEVE
ncbi:MAG TPA: nitrite reductase large subunit NirB [Stellaceae bacterium]|nr:nitrite reductase large subunit NirB [Stellaceae bacterium]